MRVDDFEAYTGSKTSSIQGALENVRAWRERKRVAARAWPACAGLL